MDTINDVSFNPYHLASHERQRCVDITVIPTFSICPKHGFLEGAHEFCPRCDEEVAARRAHSPQPVSPI